MRLKDITLEHINVDAGPIEDAIGQISEQIRNQVLHQLDEDLNPDEGIDIIEEKVNELLKATFVALGLSDE